MLWLQDNAFTLLPGRVLDAIASSYHEYSSFIVVFDNDCTSEELTLLAIRRNKVYPRLLYVSSSSESIWKTESHIPVSNELQRR